MKVKYFYDKQTDYKFIGIGRFSTSKRKFVVALWNFWFDIYY
jgi:hypothetical protein